MINVSTFAADMNKYCLVNKNIGVGGKDPVSFYQAKGSPPKDGLKKYRLKFDDVIYRFSNEKNKSLFKKNPRKYLPKLGGFCHFFFFHFPYESL